jgi:putative NIF3 family GTP cyclohydrolase 1 type 2
MEGRLPLEVKKIFLCLDFDDEIYANAVAAKPDLILTHHPFLYGSKHQVLAGDPG